ncbi:Pyroglutamyl-peptidase 1 [Tritrichomonas musculus]|uniref:Pyroglutamyl-peptidase 1 n=1 Tax=Tritrichomonas musculus TaxID=1915356 RepID=A0ABR2KFW0_9EUKA
MKLIVTGFGPFGSVIDNPSRIIAKEVVEDLVRQGYDAEFLDWRVSINDVNQYYENLQKGDYFMLHLGLYQGITKIHMEAQAINNADFSIPDADGAQPRNEQIDSNYPLDYEFVNSLPIDEWVKTLSQYFDKSLSAGTFVCNYTYFRGLTNVGKKVKGALFVHCAEFSDFPKEVQVAGVTKLSHLIISHFL